MQDVASQIMVGKKGEYYHGGALDGISNAENKSSFRRCRLIPRVMRDVSVIAPQTTIFGVPSALPIYISPASNALLGHPEGELNLTRGVSPHAERIQEGRADVQAAKTGIVQGISFVSSFPLTDILEEKEKVEEIIGEKMGMVFQVYVRQEREKTARQVKEAIEGGCQ